MEEASTQRCSRPKALRDTTACVAMRTATPAATARIGSGGHRRSSARHEGAGVCEIERWLVAHAWTWCSVSGAIGWPVRLPQVCSPVIFVTPAHARSPRPHYVATVWQTEQGLPQSSVYDMVQDRDGYLWLATWGGLVRFDGARFRVFGSADIPGLGSGRILSLHASRSGALWIGTRDGGLTRLDDGVATSYEEATGCRARSSPPSARMPKGRCGSTLRASQHALPAPSWRLTPLTGESRSASSIFRRGTEACGSTPERTSCGSGPTAPSPPTLSSSRTGFWSMKLVMEAS